MLRRIALCSGLLALLLLFFYPVDAQEVTDVPVAATEIVTFEDLEPGPTTPVVIIEAPAPEGTVEVPLSQYLNIQFIGLIALALGGIIGAAAGATGFVMFVRRIDKNTKDNLEQAYQSLPPQWQETIREQIQAGGKTLEAATTLLALIQELTDGLENTDPPAVG